MLGCQHNYKDWAKTINEVIPERKVKEVTGPTVVLGKRTHEQAAAEEEEKKEAELSCNDNDRAAAAEAQNNN